MKRFKIEQSDADIVSHGGLALIGQAVKRHTNITREVDTQIPLRHGIKHSDVLKSYLAMLCLGKNDFEAINTIESEFYFMSAMDIGDIPSEATLRQRMDNHAAAFLPIIEKASRDFLINIQPTLEPLKTGHIPLDADVTPMDNSGSHKEGVSRTYKGCDGYAPMPVYLGQEGYCLEFELREGKQHCQKDTPALLDRALRHARQITDQPLLLRLDGGNDSIENIDLVLEHNQVFADRTPVDFLIKWNPRKESKDDWLAYAEQHGRWETPRDGKRVAIFSVDHQRQWKGYEYRVRRVMRLVERTIDKKGQLLLTPEIELEGWWTSLSIDEPAVIQLYADHGTSEQFHSEFKTDLDIERLPSGKFATNALVLGASMLAYNILRWVGQNGLLGPDSPKRSKAKRRRIKTVMQELMYVAARIVKTSRSIKLSFGRGCRSLHAFSAVYKALAYG
ncbi:IS1380 family transposase [Sedimenticola hydrogenitrophicus]|uniref:IS1380 family transposase n=1 Tax=Sedimenticola hydrogenitrophicus TaxID=2967975 RepID=UPI0021A845AF|nr:IS1380 family transposase [Sedimenticola hydrogenitrophicus]